MMAAATVETSGVTRSDEAVLPAGFWRSIRPFDALLFAVFLFDRVAVSGQFPFGVIWAAVVVLIGLLRRPVYHIRHHGIILLIFGLIMIWLGVVSAYNGTDFTNRWLRILILFSLAAVMLEGRFHWFSAFVGLAGALVFVNIPAFYLGLTPNEYPPYLTGWLGDKNLSGLWYGVVLVLGLWVFRRKAHLIAWLVIMGVALYLTGSRTSMSAALVALVWFFARNRLGWLFRIGLGVALIMFLNYAEEELARIGVFADRDGTDWFRERIDVATQIKVGLTPWYGQGLGTAFVELEDGKRMFFHDAFASLQVEGGYPLLVAVLGLFVIGGLGLLIFDDEPVSRRVRVGEAACLAVLVCAWKLGEVFFQPIGMMALAFALWARLAEPIRDLPVNVFLDGARRPRAIDPADPFSSAQEAWLADPDQSRFARRG